MSGGKNLYMNVILPGGDRGGGGRGRGRERQKHPVAVLMHTRYNATANMSLVVMLLGVIIAEWML